jgi:hypothetical protein
VLVRLSGAAGGGGGGGAAVPRLVCVWDSRLVLKAIELLWLLWFLVNPATPPGKVSVISETILSETCPPKRSLEAIPKFVI